MSEHRTTEEARRAFAEDLDASADLGRDPDAVTRMTAINTAHDLALARLRADEVRRSQARKSEGKLRGR